MNIAREKAAPGRSVAKDLEQRCEVVAAIAAENAVSVDRDTRFPTEAFDAARKQRLLGILVPSSLGGDGASVSDAADLCYMLGRACASTGMIFAMHQIDIAILVRHAQSSPWHRKLLQQIATDQLLMASSTTDGQGGGDLRNSTCAVEQNGARISLTKSATVMSYGAQADGLLTTARRSPDAASSDQVLVAFLKSDYSLDLSVDWDALGMRGTCSTGFKLTGSGVAEQVLPEAYHKIHARTMMPVAHLTWSSVWAGIAASAVDRARRFVRSAARGANGQLPPGAPHLARAIMSLRALRGSVSSALSRFDSIDDTEIESLEFQTAMNLLKVNSSEAAIATVMSAMQASGLAGYRNSGEFTIGRHLRDVLSSSIMINNDRILGSSASATMLMDVPRVLRG